MNFTNGQNFKNNAISCKIPTHVKKWLKMKILQKNLLDDFVMNLK